MSGLGRLSGALASALFLVACNGSDNDQNIRLLPGDSAVVAQGAEVYQRLCAVCHGANLEGEGNWRERNAQGMLPAPPHDATGHTWHHTDQVLFDLTKFGPQKYAGASYQSDMPAYQDSLSDEDIIAVLSYIKSQWPDDIQRKHDGVNAQ